MGVRLDKEFVENNERKLNKVIRKLSKVNPQEIQRVLYKDK